MELGIVSTVIAIGYLLSDKRKNTSSSNIPISSISNIPSKNIPNGSNIFNSNRVQEIMKNEQQISNQRYNEVFKNKNKSNLIVPGPTQPYFNKVDYKYYSFIFININEILSYCRIP